MDKNYTEFKAVSPKDASDIKNMVREKRTDYALAPIGKNIFTFISSQNSDIRFGLIDIKTENIYGMSYLHRSLDNKYTYIILNSDKSLREQIFTAACEYYFYLKRVRKKENKFYIIGFGKEDNKTVSCSKYFAAELLLPAAALSKETERYKKSKNIPENDVLTIHDTVTLTSFLTVKYQIPAEYVIYKLTEEGCACEMDMNTISSIEKGVKRHVSIYEKETGNTKQGIENKDLFLSSIYFNMERAFILGNAEEKDIIEDAESIGLDLDYFKEFFAQEKAETENEDEDDEED